MADGQGWQQIPSDLLDLSKVRDSADTWATQQRQKVADVWAQAQRSLLDAAVGRWREQAAAVTQPAMTSSSQTDGAVPPAAPSGSSSPGYNDMAGVDTRPPLNAASTFGTPPGIQSPGFAPPDATPPAGYNDMGGASSPQPDYTKLPGMGGVQPLPGANPLVNIPQAIAQRVGDTAQEYNEAFTPTRPTPPGAGPFARYTPEQLAAQNQLGLNMVLGVNGEAPKVAGEAAAPLADDAEQVASAAGNEVQGVGGSLIGKAKDAVTRMFHGTGSAFDAPEAAKFDPNGLFGPGYYLTSDARVADSYAETRGAYNNDQVARQLQWDKEDLAKLQADPYGAGVTDRIAHLQNNIAYAEKKLSGAPNVRAVNVPQGLKLLDADAPITAKVGDELSTALESLYPLSKFPTGVTVRDWLTRIGPQRGETVDDALTRISNLVRRNDTGSSYYPLGRQGWRDMAQAAGYDGIRYNGGQRIPLADEAGKPIQHTAVVIFPDSLPKITNALSGRPMGVPPSVGGAVLGGVVGSQAPAENDQQRARNIAVGALGGGLVGHGLAAAGRGETMPLGMSVEDASKGAKGEVVSPTIIEASGITDPNTTYQFRAKVVPLDSLATSHTDALALNPDYPAALQPRDRARAGSAMQIQSIAKTLNPEALLADSGQLDRGAPIVGPDNVVESGNGRALALRKALTDVPDRWQAYQQALREALPSYGIDPSAIDGIKNPVLVRERITPVDRASFAQEANQAAVLQMAPTEQARQDAGRLSPSTVGLLQVSDGQSVDAALRSQANLPLVRAFLDTMPKNEWAQLVTSDGALNQSGLVRVKNALFAKTFPGPAGQRLASTFLESIDPVLKNVESGVFSALGSLAHTEALTQQGARAGNLSIGEDLAKAVDMLARLKQERIPVADYLAKPALFERELNPTQEQLLIHLNAIGRSPKQVREFLQDYAQAVEKTPPPAQTSFLGPVSVDKGDILGKIIEQQRAGLSADSTQLFSALNAEHAAAGARSVEAASGVERPSVETRTPVATPRAELAPVAEPRERVAPPSVEAAAPQETMPLAQSEAPAPQPVAPSGPAVATAERPAETTAPPPRPSTPSPTQAPPPSSPPPPLPGMPPPLPGMPPPNLPERGGNILLRKYASPDAQQIIADTAAKDPATMEAARRGVVSDQTVQDLADAVGQNVDKIVKRWKPGNAVNAETITALRSALSAKADAVSQLADIAKSGSPADLLNLQVALREHQAVQEAVSGTTAEAGRSLRALRATVTSAVQSGDAAKMQDLLKKLGGVEWTQDLATKLSQLDPNDAVGRYNFLRNAMKPQLKDYLTELYYNFLLSAPRTHLVKSMSETTSLLLTLPERAASAAVEAPLSALQGRPRQRFFGEIRPEAFGMAQGIPEGIQKALFTIQHGYSMDNVLNTTDYLRLRAPAFRGAAGAVVNFPSRTMAAAAQFSAAIAESGALYSGAYRQARIEGLSGQALIDRVADLRQNPTPSLLKYAHDQGQYRVYQQPPGKFVQSIAGVRAATPLGIGRIILPFLQTPANLVKFGLERSPLGALNPSIYKNLANKSPEAADQIGRWAMGSMAAAGIAVLAAKGDITGPAPQNPGERDAWTRTGKTPFSVRIGDKWVSYQKLEPLNQTFSQVASLVDALKRNDSATDVAAQVAATIGTNLVSQTYMQSLSGALNAIQDPARYGGRFLDSLAGSVVPSAVRTITQNVDPTMREAQGPLEAIQAQIPGQSQNLPPRLNAFGEPIQRDVSNISPIAVSQAATSPLEQELARYGVSPGLTGKTLQGLDLTRQEQAEHQSVAGQRVKQSLTQLVADPRYQQLTDLQKARALQLAITRAKDQAARLYVGQLVQRQGAAAITQRIQQKKLQRLPKAG